MSLREHYVKFLRHLDVPAVLPILFAEGMLTNSEYDDLHHPSLTDQSRCEKLLRTLPNKGRNYYHKFCCCIVWSGQLELAEKIKFDVSTVPDPNKYKDCPKPLTSTVIDKRHQPPPPSQLPPPQTTQSILILYCKDHLLETTVEVDPIYHRSADDYCQEIYNFVYTLNMFSSVPASSSGPPRQAYHCIYDVQESQNSLITNFIQWTEQQLSKCDIILLACSPLMSRALSGGTRNVIEMEKGQFNTHSVVHALTAKPVIPLFLNMPKQVTWLPMHLRSTPCYEVNVKVLQDGIGEVQDEDEFARRAYVLFDQDKRLKGFIELLRILRKEKSIIDGPTSPIDLPPPKEPVIPFRYLEQISPKVSFIWERIGTKLGLDFFVLDQIRQTNQPDNIKAAKVMFETWQETKGDEATPDVLIGVLTTLNFTAVAAELRKMMTQSN